jgi:hypothetical protein
MLKANRHFLIALVVLGFLSFNTACGIHRVYGGKVIDADAREPIEGAVVVAYWLEARATVAGESTRLEDVKETLTDKDGKWSITGPRGQEGCSPVLLFTFLTGIHYTREPYFIVFKPGYCPWPNGFSIGACKNKMQPGGVVGIYEGKNVELPRLIEREDRLRILPHPEYEANSRRIELLKKQIQFLKLIDKERKYLDLEEYGYYKELKNEK